MDLKTFKENRNLTYDQLGKLFNLSRSRTFDLCTGRKGRIRVHEMNSILEKSNGDICLEDLGLKRENC